MSVHDLHPGILSVVIEKAYLDEQTTRKHTGHLDHGPIPRITVITRPIGIGL
jgi:hypothetical protein